MTNKPVPGSSRQGEIDTRSSDARGKQADEVQSHAEKAKMDAAKSPAVKASRGDEVDGALKDQTGR